MAIYFCTLAGLLFLKELTTLFGRMDRKLNVGCGLIAFSSLLWLAAFRVDTGTDYGAYAEIWGRTNALPGASVNDLFVFLEPLFVATNIVLKTVSDHEAMFFASYALLTLYPLHRALTHFAVNQPYAYAIYVCAYYLPYAFNAMRQAVAMSLLLLSLKYILERRRNVVLCIGMIATGFHLTGALIPIIYFVNRTLDRTNWSPFRLMIVGLPVAAAIGVFGVGGKIFFSLFEYKLATHTEMFTDGNSLANTALRFALAAILIYAARAAPFDRTVRQLLNVYLIGLFFYVAFTEFNVLATRFNMFFRVIEVVLIPMLVARLRGPRMVFAYVATTILLSASFWTVANDPDYEYQSIMFATR